jgi:ABC-type uncharacterized transport system involved in gliding motility auxiliary subunit
MYRRRSVRPDGDVYRQTRRLAPGANRRGGGLGGITSIVLIVATLLVIALFLWLWRR